MKPTRKSIIAFILLVFVIYSSQAQGECALNVQEIVDRVTQECADIGENQVCYGNRNVVATQRINTVDFIFENPGDIVSLSNVQSLFVSEINPSNDEWGVAQMRLQVSSESGSQDVTMLLFGAFNIQNDVQNTQTVLVTVRTLSAEIYSAPDVTSLSLGLVDGGTVLIARGRLDDSTWLHVENEGTGRVGWISVNSVQPVNAAQSVGILPVHGEDEPYYGAMQAFTFTNGNSNIGGCDNLTSDGLLIQTPEGVARVSLLINEVSIELTGGGAGVSGTAFVQANPESETGMQVNVVQGQANVQTSDGTSQTVSAGQQSTVPLDENGQVTGGATAPIQVDLSNINIQPLLPTFTTGSSGSTDGGTGNGNGVDLNPSNDNPNGSNGGTGNGSGVDLGNGNGSNSGNSSTNSSNSSGGVNIVGGNGNGNTTGASIPTSLDEIERAQDEANRPQLTQGNIIALTLAVIAAVLVIGGIIFYTITNKKKIR